MTRNRIIGVVALLLAVVVGATSAMGQSLTTGSLTGKVENENAGLPGVTVTLTSPNLQGTRSTTTSGNGSFTFPALPPGTYSVTCALQGFQSVTKTVTVTATQPASIDVNMTLSGVQASAVVTAKSEIVSTTTQASTTITSTLSNNLPNTRTIAQAAQLSSGLNTVASLSTAAPPVTISGAPTFDNLYTVDGAVITDNVRSSPNNLFIEDAIQETTTNVNGISAEYGRFQGGVINTVTKSGGNSFSGSFRTTFTNDAWSAVSPAGEKRVQDLLERYEATLGGPIWKDHVWFFGAFRSAKTSTGLTTFSDAPVNGQTPVGGYPGIPYQNTLDEKRYQGKITLTPVANHTIFGSYMKIDSAEGNNSFGNILDTASFVQRTTPQDTLSVGYNGVFTSNLFFEALYSNRHFTFENSGSQFTDLINGTLLRDRSRSGSARYNAPTFCGVCGPEKRDNEDLYFKGTYFLSAGSLGSHNIVGGYDTYKGMRSANNHQSGSDYRIFTTSSTLYNGDIYPVINNTNSWVYYTPIAEQTQGTDTRTDSIFVNDQWRLNDRLSLNLGVRWDKNNAKNSLGATTANDSAFSPRLAAKYDVTGQGNFQVGASYAHYVGGLQDSIQDSTSAGGQPAQIIWYYRGAPINVGVPAGTQPPVTRQQAIQQVFDWFFAQGCPNFSTCTAPLVQAPVIPGLTSAIDGTLKSPYAREYTLGVTGNVGPNFSYRADFVRRDFHDFYNQVTTLSTGSVTGPTGNKLDFSRIGNTNDVERNYTGLQTQFQYRWQWLTVGANWTWSHTLGNFDAENSGSGPITNDTDSYPEYKDVKWYAPYGSMASDQRHRVRLLASADLPFIPKALGNFNLGLIQAYDTGAPYGALGAVRSRNYVTNPGYQAPPASVNYWFTARDAFRTDDIKRTDLSLTYTIKVFSTVEIFVQPQVINVFNNQGAIVVDQTVRTAVSPGAGNTFQNFNPFTTTPVQRPHNDTTVTTANWDYGPSFGKPLSASSYQQPRTFLVTAGVRF